MTRRIIHTSARETRRNRDTRSAPRALPTSNPSQAGDDHQDRPGQSLNGYSLQLAQLVAILMPKTTLVIGEDGSRDILNRQNQMLTIDHLIDDAEYLMMAVQRRQRVLHAYALFLHDDRFLSLTQISKTFKAHKWRGLTSPASCEQLMARILRGLRNYGASAGASNRARIAAEFPGLPGLTSTESQFWIDPAELKQRNKYRVGRILLLAHLFLQSEFREALEKVS